MAKTLAQIVRGALDRKDANAAVTSESVSIVEAQVSIEDAFTASFAIRAALLQGKRTAKIVLGKVGTSVASITVIEN